jgi:hypothetical protein
MSEHIIELFRDAVDSGHSPSKSFRADTPETEVALYYIHQFSRAILISNEAKNDMYRDWTVLSAGITRVLMVGDTIHILHTKTNTSQSNCKGLPKGHKPPSTY